MHDCMVSDLEKRYGIVCNTIMPVSGGYLNQKWKVSTDDGCFLVKQFSTKRYSGKKLTMLEAALQRQIILRKDGIPCPTILECEGRAIRLMDAQTAYMVMEFCPGKMEGPGTVTLLQMQSLGSACGQMHKAFSRLPVQLVKGFPLSGEKVITALRNNLDALLHQDLSPQQKEAVLAQGPILNQLTPAFFKRFPQGIAHEDFTPDNMLFSDDSLSAILDFDRNQYSYIWHDVGRAILSLALDGGAINLQKTQAFIAGYSQHLPLDLRDIAYALQLCWCIETPWWINPEYLKINVEKVERFKQEMLWLTKHWFEMEALLCS